MKLDYLAAFQLNVCPAKSGLRPPWHTRKHALGRTTAIVHISRGQPLVNRSTRTSMTWCWRRTAMPVFLWAWM